MAAPSRWSTLAIVLLGLVALGTPFHYHDEFQTANEAARLHCAMAIVDHGTLHLDAVWDDVYPGWRDTGRLPNVDVAEKDGHFLLDKAPGTSLLAVPVVLAVRTLGIDLSYSRMVWLLAFLLATVPSVAFMVILHRWLGRHLGAGSPALLAAPAVVLASPWLIYSALFFGHALAASLVGLGLLAALGPPRPEAGGDRPFRDGFLGGIVLGLAVLVEFPCALLAAGAAVAMLADPARRRRLPGLIAGGLGPLIVLLAWNTLAFGGPLAFSYGFKAMPELAEVHAEGLYGISWPRADALHGILTSPRRGLFFMAPWLLAGLAGAVWVVRDRGLTLAWRIALLIGVVGAPLVIGGFPDWHGGRCVGPRYLLFALPTFGIAAALAVERVKAMRHGVPILGALAGLTVSSVLLALAGHLVVTHISRDIANPLVEVILPVLFVGGPGPTVWGPETGLPVGAGVAVLALIAVIVLSLRGAHPASRAGLALVVLVAAGVHLVLAALPATTGPGARGRILHERGFAHFIMGQMDAEREVRREMDRLEHR